MAYATSPNSLRGRSGGGRQLFQGRGRSFRGGVNQPQGQQETPGEPSPFQIQPPPGGVTGLTPARRAAPTMVDGLQANVPVTAYAPSGQPQSAVIDRINSGAPPPGDTQTESSNPLTGGKAPTVTGKSQTVSATPAANTPNSGGIIQRSNGDSTTLFPDKGYAGPKATGFQPAPVDYGRALGFSSRGSAMPPSTDADEATDENMSPQSFQGGIGALQRPFTNPTSANIYHSYVKTLFANRTDNSGQSSPSILQRAAPSAAPSATG